MSDPTDLTPEGRARLLFPLPEEERTHPAMLRYLLALSAAIDALTAVIVMYPGDVVSQTVVVGLLAAGASLSAFALSLKAAA